MRLGFALSQHAGQSVKKVDYCHGAFLKAYQQLVGNSYQDVSRLSPIAIRGQTSSWVEGVHALPACTGRSHGVGVWVAWAVACRFWT